MSQFPNHSFHTIRNLQRISKNGRVYSEFDAEGARFNRWFSISMLVFVAIFIGCVVYSHYTKHNIHFSLPAFRKSV
jgi:hypothetical protein